MILTNTRVKRLRVQILVPSKDSFSRNLPWSELAWSSCSAICPWNKCKSFIALIVLCVHVADVSRNQIKIFWKVFGQIDLNRYQKRFFFFQNEQVGRFIVACFVQTEFFFSKTSSARFSDSGQTWDDVWRLVAVVNSTACILFSLTIRGGTSPTF